ncbi:MAG: glycosyltransferase [Gammaproteobacteria bacterium]|nr:glycosyltransferase [Gammaproteobacteria bacterium]
MTTPLVSVCVLTYNHEKYVEQALDSIFSQSIVDQCEVIIGEDNSTDNTLALVRKYENRSNVRLFVTPPGAEKIVIRGKPTGRRNLIDCLSRVRGKYVILLEGDDYWIDDTKLAKQVAMMEANPDCAICFHDNYRLYEDGSLRDYDNFKSDREMTDRDILLRHVVPHTSTVMFRNHYDGIEWPTIMMDAEIGDWLLFIHALAHGSSCYLREKMSVYRIHPLGIWSGRSVSPIDTLLEYVRILRAAAELLGERYGVYQKDIAKGMRMFKLRALKKAIAARQWRSLVRVVAA